MAARTRRAINGRRTRKPVSDAQAKKKCTGRVMTVRNRRAGFNRAGLRFTNGEAMTVAEDDIGAERFERILNEPQLRCELQA